MTRDATLTYKILVDGRMGNDGCIQTYWVSTDYLGVAIESAIEAAKAMKVSNPIACVAIVVEDVPIETVQVKPNVYFPEETHLYPIEPEDDRLRYPIGIIPSDNTSHSDPDEIVEAYTVNSDETPFCVEVVVDRRRIENVFFQLVEMLPSASALEIRICGHWDDTRKTGIWLSPDWDSPKKVVSYLKRYKYDLLYNGFVEVSVYSRQEKSTLRLDDHKIIEFYSEHTRYLEDFVGNVEQLGFKPRAPFLTIARGFHHFHYRPSNSLDRVALANALEADGFRFVESIDDDDYNVGD